MRNTPPASQFELAKFEARHVPGILAQRSKLHGQFVRTDVYADHGLGDWLESLGLKQAGCATALLKGAATRPRWAGPHALANQSFG